MLSLPTGREASASVGARVYVRHRPERTLRYQLVEAYYPVFLSHLAAEGTALPNYFEREFEDYLPPLAFSRKNLVLYRKQMKITAASYFSCLLHPE